MWQKRVLLCLRCKELADKAAAEVAVRYRSAEQAALFDLEQLILQGRLVQGSPAFLPGFGVDSES
jgi:hypothetical protein